MAVVEILQVTAFALFAVLLGEVVCAYLVYFNEDYKRLLVQVERYQKQVDQQKEAPTIKSSAAKKLSRAEEQLRHLNTQLMPFNMRVSLVNLATLMGGYTFLNQAFDGVVVARLPFTPWGIFQGLTHRNLPGEDYQEASAHLIFGLVIVAARLNIQKLMEIYQVKPRQPKQLSIWEMASEEANKMADKIQ